MLRTLSYKLKNASDHLLGRVMKHMQPSFLIIGVQKGGTSALYGYLVQHPLIVPSKIKEIQFFNNKNNYVKGNKWYEAHFPLKIKVKPNSITFEATPDYIFASRSPERIFQYNPKIKLLIILRDPVERAYSQWNMFRSYINSKEFYPLAEKNSFEDVVASELQTIKNSSELRGKMNYIRRGIYIEQIERYIQFFPRNQIYILENEAFRKNTIFYLNEILDFLEMPSFDWNSSYLISGMVPLNVGNYQSLNISGETLKLLADFYKPYNDRLFKFLGKNYDWK